jgi:cellulose synthase/poly-beta-1,6-N-acetylglucosamine synthase-like glycosyltransferase
MDYPSFEIVVVDNAPSSNATADFIQQAYGGLPQVRYVREDWPGLAAAHNRGLKEVNTPIVAFTDDDVIVDRHWLTELVMAFDVAENVGCVTGLIFPIELETPSQIWVEQYGGFNKGFARRIYDMANNRPQGFLYPYTAGTFGSGANMAFRTSALRQLGGFDPALGTGTPARGGDDLSIFFHIVANGFQLVYEPAAIVRHSHRRDYADLRKQMHDYGVGLTAYLTSLLLGRPGLLFDLALKAPYGLLFAVSPRSSKNAKKQVDYPKELTTLERRGMLYGPLAYLRSLRKASRIRQQTGLLESSAKTSSPSTPLADEAR